MKDCRTIKCLVPTLVQLPKNSGGIGWAGRFKLWLYEQTFCNELGAQNHNKEIQPPSRNVMVWKLHALQLEYYLFNSLPMHLNPELVIPAFFTATVFCHFTWLLHPAAVLIGITLVFLWRSELVKQVTVTHIKVSPLNFRVGFSVETTSQSSVVKLF